MMKFIMMMLFMIPLSLMKKWWLNQYLYFMLFFIFMCCYNMDYSVGLISQSLGCDMLSYIMILLSLWICSLMILASSKIFNKNNYYSLFMLVLLALMFSLFMAFSALNLFMFYLFFEMSLIPTLFLIIGWGYQPERLQAGMYLMFYTMIASLPMMIFIFYYYSKFSILNIYMMTMNLDFILLYISMNIVFLVKIPMFFVHLWLPKAHVEAPISGSMILAGVMLKLGGYGLMRLLIMWQMLYMGINFVFIVVSLVGGFMFSMMCLRQSDMKSLIAYSSVAHMGLVLGGIMTLNYWGMCGALVMMVAHGLCSSGLFCLSNISYERIMSRSLFLNKGLINLMPSMSLFWFLLSSSNMAAPPSLNLMGEIVLMNSLISWSWLSMLMLALVSFMSAAYSLYLYSYSQHGKLFLGVYSFSMGYLREYILLGLHWIPLNLLFLKGGLMILWI